MLQMWTKCVPNSWKCHSINEYKLMIKHHSLGSWGIFHTDQKIDLSPRMWFVGSFSWEIVSSKNCYLHISNPNYFPLGIPAIQTRLGNSDQFSLSPEKCLLDDHTLIMQDENWTKTANTLQWDFEKKPNDRKHMGSRKITASFGFSFQTKNCICIREKFNCL
jgi:hypothetical protein